MPPTKDEIEVWSETRCIDCEQRQVCNMADSYADCIKSQPIETIIELQEEVFEEMGKVSDIFSYDWAWKIFHKRMEINPNNIVLTRIWNLYLFWKAINIDPSCTYNILGEEA